MHVMELMEQTGFQHYYRWTGGEEVGGLGLDEWHPNPKKDKPTTAKFIEENVRKYMDLDANKVKIENCAKELVRRRRERIEHQPEQGRWRRHSYCTVLRCPYCEQYLETRDAVKGHIERVHPANVTNDSNFIDTLVKQLSEIHPRFPGGPL